MQVSYSKYPIAGIQMSSHVFLPLQLDTSFLSQLLFSQLYSCFRLEVGNSLSLKLCLLVEIIVEPDPDNWYTFSMHFLSMHFLSMVCVLIFSRTLCTGIFIWSAKFKTNTGYQLREGFNKKKHSFNGIFHKGGGEDPFSITLFCLFFVRKTLFSRLYTNIKRCSKASNSSTKTSIVGVFWV